jgi:hypothetical protein
MITVGGWTIAVGKNVLVLQALVFIKNLIDAATATTAEELQSESEQMATDVSSAGNVLLHMGMAQMAQVGARPTATQIARAGGGVRFAARMGGAPRVASAFRGGAPDELRNEINLVQRGPPGPSLHVDSTWKQPAQQGSGGVVHS